MNITITVDKRDVNLDILQKNYDDLSLLLGLQYTDNNGELYNYDDPYYDDPQYLKELPMSIAKDISVFMFAVYNVNINVYDLIDKYYNHIKLIESDYDKLFEYLSYMINYVNVITECILYASENIYKTCNIKTISVYINEYLYGNAFIFYNNSSSHLMMQGITKMKPLSLIDLLYPEYSGIYKLNQLIQPTLISFAKLQNFTDIFINPIGKQGKILREHYGYERKDYGDEFKCPCDLIKACKNLGEMHRLRI
jgi:hypothetical protein